MRKRIKSIIIAIYNFGKITFDIRDAFVFGGAGLIAYGVYQIYPPAAAIVTGVIFFWLGVRKVK